MNSYEKMFKIIEEEYNVDIGKANKIKIEEISKLCMEKKKKILIEMEQEVDKIYFIIDGVVRGFSIDENGNETTCCFVKSGWCVPISVLNSEPSEIFIQTLTECICIEINYKKLIELISLDKELKNLYEKIIYKTFCYYSHRQQDLLTKSASELYKKFFEDYGDVECYIEKQYIASYLGINASTLSRIINKI